MSRSPTEHSAPGPYADLSPDQLLLRDRLALDRTLLANERTLLAYARTAVALFIAGISLVHLPYLNPETPLGSPLYSISGWVLVGASGIVLVVGYWRYRVYRALIRRAGEPPAAEQP